MDTAAPISSKPSRKRWSCCLIMALCAAVPLLAMFLLLGAVLFIFWIPAPRLVISEETTRITGPLTAEGYIDFFKALEQKIYPPELATDDNGFRIFVRTFGDVGTLADQEFYRLQKYAKLGLDPNVPPTMVLPREPQKIIEDFCKAQGEEYRANWMIHVDATTTPEQIATMLELAQKEDEERNKEGKTYRERPNYQWDRIWTLEDYPMLADWINEIDEPLDAITEMIRKPIFALPLYQSPESVETGKPISLYALLLPDVQLFQEIARMFLARATYRIGQGNIDGAIDDKLTLHRLGRQVSQKCCLVQVLIGTAIEGMAAATPVGANPEHPLTEQQIRRILDGLDALPPRAPIYDAIEWERIAGLSEIQHVAHGGRWSGLDIAGFTTLPSGGAFSYNLNNDPGFWLLNYASIDWNIVYRRMNEAYDAMHEPSPKTKLDSIVDQALTNWEPDKWDSRIWSSDGRADILADFFIANSLPATDSAEGAIRRAECSDNLQRLTFAILLYQLEHEKIPDENWAMQIEKYLGENPEQYFSCPSNPSAKGMTTYAMVQYGDELPTNPETLLLVELSEAVSLDKAVISVDEVLARQRTGSVHRSVLPPSGMMVAYRCGAVRFLSESTEEAELFRMLGRETE